MNEGIDCNAGPTRSVYLGLLSHDEQDISESFIEVPAKDWVDPVRSERCHVIVYDYYHSGVKLDRCDSSVLVWKSRPTVDQLIGAYRVSGMKIGQYNGSPFAGLQRSQNRPNVGRDLRHRSAWLSHWLQGFMADIFSAVAQSPG